MKNDLLFECWCIFFTKLRVYKKSVEIAGFFGLFTTTIPAGRIASVQKDFTGVSIETSGGARVKVSPWNNSPQKRADIVRIISKITK